MRMKTINFRNGVSDEITDAGISLVCDENMNLKISEEDYERLRKEFPSAFDDSYIVEEEDV